MAVLARDLMQTQVVVVAPEDPLDGVVRLFSDEGIHGAPVVDDERRVVGVVSTSDLLRSQADSNEAERPEYGYFEQGVETFPEGLGGLIEGEQRCVRDVMTDAIVWVEPTARVAEVARTLRENRVHRALVLEDDVLVGIISSFDLMGLLEKQG